MPKACAQLVPRLLNDDKKKRRIQVSQYIIESVQTESDFFFRVITCDEIWIFIYIVRAGKKAPGQWKSQPLLKKAICQSQKS